VSAAGFEVTLSFDNGPEPEATPAVLEVLRRRGLRAGFFVVGSKLLDPARLALAERARDEGHRIGNHTFTHGVPLGERMAERGVAEAEIGRTQALLDEAGLTDPDRLFRPFGGGGNLDRRLLSGEALEHLLRHRFTCVLWNAVPGDWRDPEGWVGRALAQCHAASPALLVLHDLPTGAMRHLDRFLGMVADAGGMVARDFPAGCVPIRRGEVVAPIDAYVTRGEDQAA
jgi:peptidoglycan/xylan/chitin deacetylase (PgdA/CDA1 family)